MANSLHPDGLYYYRDKNGEIVCCSTELDYSDVVSPDDPEMIEKHKKFTDEVYIKNRLLEYPSIQECVHAMLDNDNNELDTLQAKRAEIKLKYPK